MYHIHEVIDTDNALVIDPRTRMITNHSDPIKKIMRGDHNCERVTFTLPRYIDGHDMSLCNLVRVHFVNIGEDGTRIADVEDIMDLQVDPNNDENVSCTWLISGKATKLVGPLNFGIQFACIRNDYIVYSWSTAICTHVTVSPSLDSSSEESGTEYEKTINDVPFTVDDKNKLNDLPTGEEIEKTFGDVESALDVIIAQQEAIIEIQNGLLEQEG